MKRGCSISFLLLLRLKNNTNLLSYSPEVRSLTWILQAKIKVLAVLVSFGASESRIRSLGFFHILDAASIP